MILRPSSNVTRACVLTAVLLIALGCSETYTATALRNPTPAIEAVLVVSDMSAAPGSAVVVFVKANANVGSVGSYTARIAYDAEALRFDGDAVSGSELRVTNPSAGLIRIAGVAPGGFADGLLAAYKFTVLRAGGTRSLSLSVNEMHMINHVDAKANLTIAPPRMISQ